jgi:glycosyltransferase involved in cell wall biosynthesis
MMEEMTNTIILDENYSTTRLLTNDMTKETELFLPENTNRKAEGGLRTKGYFKKSYDDKPLISIVTVVYNGEKFLAEAIESVLSQGYDNIEYIIIDGGSKDKTVEIIKKYEDQIDYWVSEPDKGMYDALNKGFSSATGELINFCNSDDFFYSNDVIEKIVKRYNYDKFDCCYGYGEFIDWNSQHLSYLYALPFKKRYIVTLGTFFMQSTFFWTKEIMQKSGLFNLNYQIASDRDFIGRIMLLSNRIVCFSDVIAKFRKHGESFGDLNSNKAEKESLAIKNNFLVILCMNKRMENFLEFYDRLVQKIFRSYKKFIAK